MLRLSSPQIPPSTTRQSESFCARRHAALEALRRPVRFRLDRWRNKREAWQKAVESELPEAITDAGSDTFQTLAAAKVVAVSCARCILGESGGKFLSPILHQSGESI